MNLGGRPRKWDREQLAKDLLEWSTNPTSFNLIQFARPRMLNVLKLPEFAAECPKFREALDLAKQSIAMNRYEATLEGAIPYADYAKNEAQYDPLRDRFQKREKVWESKLEVKKDKAKLDHAHKLKKDENSDQARLDAERLSNYLKAESLINDDPLNKPVIESKPIEQATPTQESKKPARKPLKRLKKI